jgi:membrane protein DedA with SNARE-associated domain
MMAVVVAAAIAGDSVGYEVGRHFGPRLLVNPRLARHRVKVERARGFLRDHGPSAVFLGRFVAFFRALMPALSGLSRMRYRTFLKFNALGGIVWGVGFVLLGYLAGNAYKRVEKVVGTGLAVVIGLVVVGALVVWRVRRVRAEAAEEKSYEERPEEQKDREEQNGHEEQEGEEGQEEQQGQEEPRDREEHPTPGTPSTGQEP